MKTRRFANFRGARRNTPLLLTLALAFLLLQGCTELDERPTSAITPDNFNQTEQEVLGSLASVYSVLRQAQVGSGGMDGAIFTMAEITSDVMIVPTRGSDWFDNGRWLELQRHTWESDSPSGLDDINRAWTGPYTGITRANAVLAALEDVTVPNEAAVEAELRTLRAFYYYWLMDLFGGVPIVTTTEIEPRERATRAEVFQFIDDELNATRADLPDNWPAGDHGRMTKGAANAILASMYLNAAVFTTDAPSATAYNSCMDVQVGGQTACAAAVAAADRVLNSGQYSLATNWRSNFEADNFASPENILVSKNMNQDSKGFRLLLTTLHYNQFNPSPWNGFAALAETYNAFDADDQRREMWLAGPQVNLDTGDPVTERDNITPLDFTVDIIDETQASENEGPRIVKWPPDPDRVGPDGGNDFTFFRLADIYLIKAEALNEVSPGSAEALQLLNMLRERVFEPDEPLAAVDRDVILAERLFELAGETKRRQDLIRHGKYTDPWSFKLQTEPFRVLMPIPQPQLDANPCLSQNTGYGSGGTGC
jgi:hypothetical protein